MAKGVERLTDRQVKTLPPGKHADGGGLYLLVDSSGARRWAFFYTVEGRRREMGLGGLTLAKARERARALKAMVAEGTDPLAAKRADAEAKAQAKVAGQSFGTFADHWFEHFVKPGLSNAKHQDQWRMTLTTYCEPIRSKPVASIDTADILCVLKPLWTSKPETALRLRARIERALDAATVTGARGDKANPARWKGHLDNLLPKPKRLARGHLPAMDWQKVPAFMTNLRARQAMAARALEFIILTASRAGEGLGARWGEIDLDAAVWTVPADRMKMDKEHRVPLSSATLALLSQVRPVTGGEPEALVFPGPTARPLSLTALDGVRERMGVEGVTTHGFRSSFRDWAGEATTAPREVAEGCLAHEVGNAVERAYRRGDALDKRRALLDQWSAYCAGHAGADVVNLSARAAKAR